MRMSAGVWLLVLGMFGCSPPPEAPSELGELSLYLYREFEQQDPAILAAGLENLGVFLDDLALAPIGDEPPREGREWQPPVLSAESREGLPVIEGVPEEAQLAVSLAGLSSFPVAEHSTVLTLTDQTPVETDSSASYDRSFLSDPDCFLTESCALLKTFNVVHRDQLVLDVVYEAYKDFRWVSVATWDEPALIGRSWTEDRFFSESGESSIDQSYSIEVWLPTAGGTLRYMSFWSSMTLPLDAGDSLLLNLTASGMDEIFEKTETFLSGGDG